MNFEVYYHQKANNVIDTEIMHGVENSLRNIKFDFSSGTSKELRRSILEELAQCGWSDKVVIERSSNISITSMNGKYGMCLQTGNMGRFYADILKLEYLFKKRKIESGIYIIPLKASAKLIGSNIANYERFVREVNIFKELISVPLIIYGLKNG